MPIVPPGDPPAGTHWVLHQNVDLTPGVPGWINFFSATTATEEGWYGEVAVAAVPPPELASVAALWFKQWFFAQLLVHYTAQTYTPPAPPSQLMAVQPGVDGGPGPYSAAEYLYVKSGDAWVDLSAAPVGTYWPPWLHIKCFTPKLGYHYEGIYQEPTAPPVVIADLTKWKGDVWAAEPIDNTNVTPPTEPPVVLGGTVRPSPQPPPFQLTWPQKEVITSPSYPGDLIGATWARMGFQDRPFLTYQLHEHWWSPEGQAPQERYEREFVFVNFQAAGGGGPGGAGELGVWSEANWNQAVWAP